MIDREGSLGHPPLLGPKNNLETPWFKKPGAWNIYFKSRHEGVGSRESGVGSRWFFWGVGVGSRESDEPGSRSRESESDTQATDSQALL